MKFRENGFGSLPQEKPGLEASARRGQTRRAKAQPEFPIRIRGFPSKFSAPGTLVDVSFQPDGRAEKCIPGLKGTEDFGAYTTELNFAYKIAVSVWSGFGTGNEYREWDFAGACTFYLGMVFFVPVSIFVISRASLSISIPSHPKKIRQHEKSGHEEHDEAKEHHEHSHAKGHSHNTCANETFFVLRTKAIPYVTPSMLFVCDLSNTPGSYLEIRVDRAIPLYREIFQLQPYALLGLNLGYDTTA